ncbi:STAS domain-containing protein [Streptomyces sp. NPDC056716]|uniref:STAS domain-containing protein n=1 Tax=unclassified Streptomyces TaxID=2593676 RepID=UPI0036ACD91F
MPDPIRTVPPGSGDSASPRTADVRAGQWGRSGQVRIRRERDRVLVGIGGELCLDDTAMLDRALRSALAEPVPRVELDLAALTFWDCSVLNVLLAARHRALAKGQSVAVTAAGPAARRLLALTGTGPLFSAPPCEPSDSFPSP